MFSKNVRRVVLIDDNEQSCRLLSRYFMLEDDIEVVGIAHTGAEGVNLTRQLKPDLVLTDFNLPDINGKAIAASIKTSHPEISVVVMSADREDEVVEQVLQAGASDFILKNGDTEKIIAVIRHILQ